MAAIDRGSEIITVELTTHALSIAEVLLVGLGFIFIFICGRHCRDRVGVAVLIPLRSSPAGVGAVRTNSFWLVLSVVSVLAVSLFSDDPGRARGPVGRGPVAGPRARARPLR